MLTHRSAGVGRFAADFELLDSIDMKPACTQQKPNLTELIWLMKTINTKNILDLGFGLKLISVLSVFLSLI